MNSPAAAAMISSFSKCEFYANFIFLFSKAKFLEECRYKLHPLFVCVCVCWYVHKNSFCNQNCSVGKIQFILFEKVKFSLQIQYEVIQFFFLVFDRQQDQSINDDQNQFP